MFDILLTDEEKALKEEVRRFAKDEIPSSLIRAMDSDQVRYPKEYIDKAAAQNLLGTKSPLGSLRGRMHQYNGVPVLVTYHPAAILRNPALKRPTWDDMQVVMRSLGLEE